MTLLMNKALQIDEVLLNSDASKNSAVFEQLRYALADANVRDGTIINRRLSTSTIMKRRGTSIEILYPPDVIVLSGVGSKTKAGKRLTSNSMSAAIRVSRGAKSSILLAGDIELDCIEEWKTKKIQPSAKVLVFPHHGGLPGTADESDAQLFAYQIAMMVNPEIVIFSNHRTKFGNPRDCILQAITKAAAGTSFACTQLPQRLHSLVNATGPWSLHKSPQNSGSIDGSICLVFQKTGIKVFFGEKP
jgi:competence protein ComEC